ncbi:aromatic hydrocarbon degradation protein [Chlorobaculum limnaeum]|uniref:Aromatic hydrocarbon degradation protein n=1 Tax=Chlorobaculum limnaeum TaxID=274537 RepID=A0A1D8D467_CHLLM|nr:outer membrane protein transport protein [Chlorobaculum limnaeum]AOS84645.1 aromatic hydrocarbon degradation protein [Chlorobaculum limnaeum]
MIRKTACSAVSLLVLIGATPAFATNGMNLEGYGSKSMAMGGTGSAYDTGNSASMNNPATLGFMKEGASEIGFGIRGLHPDISLENGGNSDNSDATSFFMPSMSYMRRDGRITWGMAMLAQGGMGTDYGSDSPMFSMGTSMNGVPGVLMSGEDIRSEVGVGRIMFPVAYNLTDKTTLGASFDVVIASMDLQMDMDGQHFAGMMAGNGGSVGGSMRTSLESMMGPGGITDINYARFDFTNDSPFMGKAVGFGTGLKFGLTHKVSKAVTIGASYHTQTKLSDLETSNATLSFSSNMGTQPVSGKIKVRNFEWPATFAAGIALNPSDKFMIAGDVKFIDWSTVMDKFQMTFIADASSAFSGQNLDVTMDQKWKDQTIWSVGVQYKATDKLALRAGASFSTNPVPDKYLNPLFPAITTNHYTCGFGYRVNDATSVAAAFSWAPRVEATNGDNTVISHSQTNWALNLTHML